MKKKLIAIIVFVSIGIVSLVQSRAYAQTYLLGMIEVNFCNYQQSNKELDLTAKAGEKTQLCVQFTNKADIPITINTEFLDSIITEDSKLNRACNASDRPKTQFGNFLAPYSGNITLSAKSSIQKNFTITYPIGFTGLSHGCMAYYIAGADISNNEMFTVRIRSVKYIDIFVSDTPAKQMISISQSPILTKVDNEYIISFGIRNQGNIDEKIHITSTLTNIFGYQKDFSFDVILPAETGTILTTPTFIMPVYGGPYRFKNRISYMPQFNFNVNNAISPSDLYAGGEKKTLTILFVRSRQSWVTIICIILFIYSIFKKRPKSQDLSPKKKENKN